MDKAEPKDGYMITVRGTDLRFAARPNASLLTSARAVGWVWPSSCRNGTCRECRCRVLEGRVHHSIEWPGLSADEKLEGWILPCVAQPDSDLVLEAPLRSIGRAVAPPSEG